MSNKQEEKTWDEYNKFYSYLEKNSELKEAFESGIKCFSSYLSHTNQEYVYNSTYLAGFNEEFFGFIEAFQKKYAIVQDLLKKVTEYHNITLKIDRYWMFQTDKEGKKKVTTLSGSNYVGEDKMLVECSIMCNMKRYIFHRNEKIVFDEESYIELKKDLIEFMEKYSAKNGKEG